MSIAMESENTEQLPAIAGKQRMEPATLAGVVELAVAGDQNAWRELVNRYTPLVFNVVRKLGLSTSDTEDACQLTWLRVARNLTRIREPLALPGWITTTARNEALRILSANRRRSYLLDRVRALDTEIQFGDGDVLDGLLLAERQRAVLDGLASLKPKHRELMLLVQAEPELTYQEISKRLGVPVGSIGPTRARCVEKLRASDSVRALAQA